MMDEASLFLEALQCSQQQQLRRIDRILTEDERELIEVYMKAYPDGPLTANELDIRDGGGRAGKAMTRAVLHSIPH